ncbi:MAG: hypothetical protein LLF89_08730, partial [Spirochaetaceae bacterium]|nr:hypothetical protein [Spirochaetaceae bacterium]
TLTDSSPSVTYTFSAVFWQTSSMSAGFYELPITFRLRNEAFVSGGVPSTPPISTITMVLRFEIGTSSTIYFKSGSYEIFELAFDEVTAQTPKAFTISVQANFRFYLSLSSKNGGYLENPSTSDTIPYTLSIDGTTIPLSAGTYKFSKRQSSTGFGTNSKDYSAILTIGDITSYSAGTYTDILSFTVTSN